MPRSEQQKLEQKKEVRRKASRYILEKLGDRLWAGKPTYDGRSKKWKVNIHSRSLPPNVALGEITLNANGDVVRAPSRQALQREFQRLAPETPIVVSCPTIVIDRRGPRLVVVNRHGPGWTGKVQQQPQEMLIAAGDGKEEKVAGKGLTTTISTIRTDYANVELRAQPYGQDRIEIRLTLTTLDEPKRGIECQVRWLVKGKEEDKIETDSNGRARFPNIPIGEHEFLCKVTEEHEIAIKVIFKIESRDQQEGGESNESL